MSKRRSARIALFGATAALVAGLLPAGLASGSSADGDPSVVLLTLGSNDHVKWMTDTQAITTRNNKCAPVTLAASPQILSVTAIGGELGLIKDGLGVKSQNDGTGDPCGRIEADDGEAISVSLGSHLDGYSIAAIDLDLELKFNAMVDVVLKREGSIVFTSSFSGSGGSDDGPDSGDGDNYRLFLRPMNGGTPILFDEVLLDPSAGAISLEGGADGTDEGVLDNSNSSQFEVVKGFDGQVTCDVPVTIDDSDVPEVVGVVTMQALKLGTGPWDADCTELKNYNDDVTSSSLLFAPVLENSLARYTMVLTIEDQSITTNGEGQTTSLVMEYNDGFGSGDRTLQPCLGQPELTAAFFEASNTGLLPAGEFACYYGVALTPTGNGVGTEVWKIFFEDDPGFQF